MAACGKCAASVTSGQESVSCVQCKKLFHASCVQVRSAKLQTVRGTWKCDSCSGDTAKEKDQGSSGPDIVAVMKGIDNLSSEMTRQLQGVNDNVTDVKTQLATVNDTITGIKSQLDNLAQENLARHNEYLELKQENEELKAEVATLKKQVLDIEQYSRRDNIEIVGVPFSQREDVYDILNRMAKVIDVPFARPDVSIAHRLPDSKNTGKPNIIVKFVNRYAKVEWINQARKRKPTAADLCSTWESTKIYLNDHLTFHNKQLLGHLRGLVREKKIVGAWSRECKVLMRVREDGPVHHVTGMQLIRELLAK